MSPTLGGGVIVPPIRSAFLRGRAGGLEECGMLRRHVGGEDGLQVENSQDLSRSIRSK